MLTAFYEAVTDIQYQKPTPIKAQFLCSRCRDLPGNIRNKLEPERNK